MDTLKRTRIRTSAVLMVFCLALLIQGTLVASADQPRSDSFDLDETSTGDSLCGFPVVMHEEGTLRTTLFFDQDGQISRITDNWEGVQASITNPENGRSLSYHIAGHDGFTVDRDGDMTFFTKGLRGILTVPGYGAISGEAGNIAISISPTGEIELHRSGFLREGDFSVACDYLQGP
jgi:hypothetical protein